MLWYNNWYYFTAIFVVWCQFITVLWRETWLNHWEQRQMGQPECPWKQNFLEFHSKWSVRWPEMFSPCLRLLLSLTSSQVAFGADFERDPFVQSQAGKEGLTSLLTDTFEGIQLVNDYPFVKVTAIYKSKINGWLMQVDCVFDIYTVFLDSSCHLWVESMLALFARSEKSVGTALSRGWGLWTTKKSYLWTSCHRSSVSFVSC